MERKEWIKSLEEKIRLMGAGAPARLVAVATSASVGNATAKLQIENLIGRPVASQLDYWDVMTACTNLMTKNELNHMELDATMSLKAQRDPIHDADAYLANRLGELRRNAGLTQQQLSQKSGVNLTTLQKLENGANRLLGCRTEIALKLSKVLNVTVEELTAIE